MLDKFKKRKREEFDKHYSLTNPELALWAKNALMTPEGVMLMASAEAFIDDLISEVERATEEVKGATYKGSSVPTNIIINVLEDNLNNTKV